MTVARIPFYTPGTAGRVGDIILVKWSQGNWSAADCSEPGLANSTRVWANTALAAYRMMKGD